MTAMKTAGELWFREHRAGRSWDEIARDNGKTKDGVRVTATDWAHRHPDLAADEDASDHPSPKFATPLPEQPSAEELIDLARRNQKVMNAIDPILIHEKISIESDGPIAIVFCSCLHLGSRYVNHEAFEKFLKKVLQIPRLYWFALGDETDGMTAFFDARSAHEQALADPKTQRKLLAHVLDQLAAAGKLLCGFSSQHGSQWVERKVAEDPIKKMYLDRHIPYFDGQGYIHLNVGGEIYKIFAGHELPGNSQWNKTHAQKRAATFKVPSADVVLQGDKHSYGVHHETLETWEYLVGERPSPYQWYVQVGTTKTGADPYTIRSWSPGVWDWPILVFRADRHEIAQAADLDVVRLMLNQW